MNIGNLPDEEFEVIVINMLTKLRGRMDEHSENFNKEVLNHKESNKEMSQS